MSQSRAYQLLDQGRVIRALQAASNSTDVEITEATARHLKPALPAVQAEVRSRIATGESPAVAVAAAVKAHRSPSAPEATEEPPPDLVAELEFAAREIDRLNELVAALQKDDRGREIVAWSAKYAQLNARLQQQITTASEARKEAERQSKLLAKIRRALRVEANGEILPTVQDLMR